MPDNEIRDQLATLIDEHEWSRLGGTRGDQLAEKILAAGWRSPARVIEHQAQLSGWPIGTVIRDAQDGVARRTRMGDGPAWIVVGGWAGGGRPVALPATVLYEPEEGEG